MECSAFMLPPCSVAKGRHSHIFFFWAIYSPHVTCTIFRQNLLALAIHMSKPLQNLSINYITFFSQTNSAHHFFKTPSINLPSHPTTHHRTSSSNLNLNFWYYKSSSSSLKLWICHPLSFSPRIAHLRLLWNSCPNTWTSYQLPWSNHSSSVMYPTPSLSLWHENSTFPLMCNLILGVCIKFVPTIVDLQTKSMVWDSLGLKGTSTHAY